MGSGLDFYRQKASFNSRNLKIFLANEEILEFEENLGKVLQEKLFFDENLDERSLALKRLKVILEVLNSLNFDRLKDWEKVNLFNRWIIQIDHSASTLLFATSELFAGVLKTFGTEKQKKILDKTSRGELFGAYCMTEIGHGTNVKAMKTRATFDKTTQSFILQTPDFEGAKCWSAHLANSGSYAVVYAQLYLNDEHHGLHMFLVPIRDPKTMRTYPGLTIVDMGAKIGLNGVDNGVLFFDNYRIPRENLLGKNFGVTPEGEFQIFSDMKASTKAEALGVLCAGRAGVTFTCEVYTLKALTIALRYAAVRKQFGPEEDQEVPILEYQSHQFRLLPYLAGAFVLKFFTATIMPMFLELQSNANDENQSLLMDLGKELHVITAASKAVSSWLARDCVQECREACGGHGYLTAAGIGDSRNNNDANCTYEGDSHVIIQQTSNWLIKFWPNILKKKKITSPLKSINFLSNYEQIMKRQFSADTMEKICKPDTLIDSYQWLVCYLLQSTAQKLETLSKDESPFWAKNNIQVFYAKHLATAFIEHYFLQVTIAAIGQAKDEQIQNVLLKLFYLYGYWSLEKFLSFFYEGGYFKHSKPSILIRETVLLLCKEIKNEAISLIDAVAPPDFIVNSVLGASDGLVYERLEKAFFGRKELKSKL